MLSWEDAFGERYGYSLPEDYLVFDCETSGLGSDDVPVAIACATVRGKKLLESRSWLINWTVSPVAPANLCERLEKLARDFASRGQKWHYSFSLLATEGASPAKVFSQLHQLLADANKEGLGLVGHNALRFDIPALERIFDRLLDVPSPFEGGLVYDTGAMEKAIAGGLLPYPDEPLADFFVRVVDTPLRGVRWSLANCVKKYALLPGNSAAARLHTADFDVQMTHLLFEKHRDVLAIAACRRSEQS